MRDDLLNPIPGANPSGENLRYAPVYDQIKEARREEEGGSLGDWQHDIKKADWPLVIKLAGEALAKKSKDLQLAAWLTEAMLRREEFAGLADGLDLMRGLLENFWETLYPEVEDGDAEFRAMPLEWVGSRLNESLQKAPITSSGLDWLKYRESRSVGYESDSGKAEARAAAIEEGKITAEEFDDAVDKSPGTFYQQKFDELTRCLESIQALDDCCAERFGDSAPNFGTLRSGLEEIKQAVYIFLQKKRGAQPAEAMRAGREGEPDSAPAPKAEPGAAAYAATAAAPARAPAVRPKGASLAAEPADRDDAVERVIVAAAYLRQQEPYSPVPYLMLRGLRWGELRANGPEPDPAVLEPPSTEVRQQLRNLARDGQWQELLEAAETAMAAPCGRAWLDLQRYAVRACEELGSYYDPIASAIRSELRALLSDLPGLLELSLTDDTPVAGNDTQAWIREKVTPQAAQTQDFGPLPEPEESDVEQEPGAPDPFELAMEAARGGRPEEAIEILTREAAQERSGRARFQRKVQLAQICLASGHEAIAQPILEELAGEIERRRLEEWEAPDVVAHALVLLYRSMGRLGADDEERRKVYGRICRLDAVQALACSR